MQRTLIKKKDIYFENQIWYIICGEHTHPQGAEMIAILLVSISFSHATDIRDYTDLLPEAWKSAPTSFSTTYSPCLDGLIVNFRSNGCKSIAQSPRKIGKDSVGLMCMNPDVKNGWTTIEHAIVPTESSSMRDIPGWDFICVDPNITMYIPEPVSGEHNFRKQ